MARPKGVRMLFRTGAKEFAAFMPHDATPIFFPEKENGRRPSKRKAFYIGSLQLEEMHALRNVSAVYMASP